VSLGLLMVLLLAAGTLPVMVRQFYPPLPPSRGEGPAGCVVVLGAGIRGRGIARRSSRSGLLRLARAVDTARRRGLPLLISGGGPGAEQGLSSEARLLAAAAEGYGLSLWLEEHSRNTSENARNSAAILVRKGICRVVLVTDRPHMARAMLCFQRAGIEVEPVPVDRLPSPVWMPSAGALSLLPEIWYEWAALLWYRFKNYL
jgi:uncharacterized SAM-binding protein YcdF (DUF218 family)